MRHHATTLLTVGGCPCRFAQSEAVRPTRLPFRDMIAGRPQQRARAEKRRPIRTSPVSTTVRLLGRVATRVGRQKHD